MKYFLTICILLFSGIVYGQLKPVAFPEDIQSQEIKARCYCSPGVKDKSRSRGLNIAYRWLGGGTYKEQNTALTPPFSSYNNLQHLEFNMKIPVLIKDEFKLLLGYKYETDIFSFDEIGADFSDTFQKLEDENLKSNSFSVILSKPLNETRYLAFRLRYSLNGDYDAFVSFQDKYAIYKVLGVFGVKPNEDLEWGFGVNFSKSFRRTSILPFFVYNKNFNSKWGIETVFPGFIFGRYNLDRANIFLFGVEYGSQSFRMGFENSSQQQIAYAYNHSEFISSVSCEHRFAPWFWGNIKAGYQVNFSSDFDAKNQFTPAFTADPTDAFFFQVGFFISPPNESFNN